MDKLKPCPFCGKNINIYYNSRNNSFMTLHEANAWECFEMKIVANDGVKSLADAYRMWNRRVNDD